jgi:hypothetical protein
MAKPYILVLWGDGIGWWNISYNNRGQMGYRTPNIDRIGNEGADRLANAGARCDAKNERAIGRAHFGNLLRGSS